MKQIPQRRLFIYLLIMGAVPVLGAFTYNFAQAKRVEEAYHSVSAVRQAVVLKLGKQSLNRFTRDRYLEADRYYIDKFLEPIVLMGQQATDLNRLVKEDPQLPNRELLSRLKFLNGEDNQLRFSECAVEDHSEMRETLEALVHPVEVDQADLPLLLSRLEGVELDERVATTAMPQLIVTEFKLQRKRLHGDNEAFLLDLKLIKREYS